MDQKETEETENKDAENCGNAVNFELVLLKIESEIKKFNELKSEFAQLYLCAKYPDTLEESAILMESFLEELKKHYHILVDEFIGYKDHCPKDSRGLYYNRMGKFCILFEDRAQDALPFFEKAVKFDPDEIEFWNSLGDCYLTVGNLPVAKNCFNEAIRRKKNCWSYRSLSIVCRKEASEDNCDILAAVNLGVNYAKEAIKLSPCDSHAWLILGNAYMSHFLVVKDSLVPIKALQAYKQAEKNDGHLPELYFNKAIALLYAEDYGKCLEAFEECIRRDPVWKLAWEKYYTVKGYISKISEFCLTRGKLTSRKITQYILALSRESATVSTKCNYKKVIDLAEGVNHGKIVLGKVIWSCEIDDSFPFTFGFVDGSSYFVVVTVFNLKTGKGVRIGDTVALPNPNYSLCSCSIGGRVYKFMKIRVDSPKDITINGKPLPCDHMGQSLTITKCE